ncbi:MAG: FG-GAP repeat domain-containing protein, partial [Thermoproteota archaeon]
EAPFRIWNWTGKNFNLEKGYNWAGFINSIYAADLDGDSWKEIITGGQIINKTGSYPSLRIWRWDGVKLDLKASYEGVNVNSIFAEDIDNERGLEILTAGEVYTDNKSYAQLCIWQWQKNILDLEGSVKWCKDTDASANSVYASDLNHDGELEIITGGYDHGLTNSSEQIRIWNWNGEQFWMEINEEWRIVENGYGLNIAGKPMGNTLVNKLEVGDIDGDRDAEIVTGGFTYDGERVNAEIRIWSRNQDNLILENSRHWISEDITEVKSLSLGDVNGDGRIDIITSGMTAPYGSFSEGEDSAEKAQLRMWQWNGEKLTLKQKKDWLVGEGVCAWNVATGDVDKDGTVEVLTVGCMHISGLCDPDLRIWSVPEEPDFMPYFLLALGIATILVITFLFIRRVQGRD